MRMNVRILQTAVRSRLLVAGVGLLLVCAWLGFAGVERVLAQGGAAAPAAVAQSQPSASPAPPAASVSATTVPATTGANYLVSQWSSFAIALAFLVVVLVMTIAVKSKDGINFFQSPDGAVSVAKVQIWMWTMTIIFSYVYLFLWQGPPDKFPDSLWELMGISALSTGAAKYIASVTDKGVPQTPEVQAKIARQNWLVSMLSDDGEPSMMRLQLFGWTLVTVFLFLMYLHKNRTLWDVPQTLVILMGISHAGYLGDKGASAAKSN